MTPSGLGFVVIFVPELPEGLRQKPTGPAAGPGRRPWGCCKSQPRSAMRGNKDSNNSSNGRARGFLALAARGQGRQLLARPQGQGPVFLSAAAALASQRPPSRRRWLRPQACFPNARSSSNIHSATRCRVQGQGLVQFLGLQGRNRGVAASLIGKHLLAAHIEGLRPAAARWGRSSCLGLQQQEVGALRPFVGHRAAAQSQQLAAVHAGLASSASAGLKPARGSARASSACRPTPWKTRGRPEPVARADGGTVGGQGRRHRQHLPLDPRPGGSSGFTHCSGRPSRLVALAQGLGRPRPPDAGKLRCQAAQGLAVGKGVEHAAQAPAGTAQWAAPAAPRPGPCRRRRRAGGPAGRRGPACTTAAGPWRGAAPG